MCGIVGYIGKEPTDLFRLLKTGLINLEYRGYDSAGLACLIGDNFIVTKCIGGPGNLSIERSDLSTVGIGHTRWATHGGISEANAHPHLDCCQKVAVVHNGTIENYGELKTALITQGHIFTSETDSEVLAHLIEQELKSNQGLRPAVESALAQVVGAYGLAVVSTEEPNLIIAARRGSPLLIGLGKSSLMVASDQNALTEYCDRVVFLDDNELVELRADGYYVYGLGQSHLVDKRAYQLERQDGDNGKGDYDHFMIEEIMEQAHTLRAAFSGRLDLAEGIPVLGGVRDILPLLQDVKQVILTGCGTAYHAALYGKYLLEQILDIPVRAEIASELLVEKVNEDPKSTLVVFVSQSGETADTKEALIELKRRGFLCLGLVNVAGSSIARAAGVGIYIRAGVERAVASTKAFTSQIAALLLLGITMARQRSMSKIEGQKLMRELEKIPNDIEKLLKQLQPIISNLARELQSAKALYFLGKKYSYPVALEGSLKVKEITYLPTEAYPSGEIKHGPLALVDKNFVAFVIAPEGNLLDKASNTVHEIKARGGKVILITNETAAKETIGQVADQVITVPFKNFNFLYPLYTVIPLQLLSYELAKLLGREIDKPRNLAKSVTVQ
ncbi:MAG: glutamine--fructose-6-phosphate transaminase (isomerizing) [Candidatus Komeilibacteria bacterium]